MHPDPPAHIEALRRQIAALEEQLEQVTHDGRDFSTRNLRYSYQAILDRGLDPQPLFEGTHIQPDDLLEANDWITWDQLIRWLSNASIYLDEQDYYLLGKQIYDHPSLRLLSLYALSLPSTLALYRWIARVGFGPRSPVVRAVRCEIEPQTDHHILARCITTPSRSLPRCFCEGLRGAFERAPTMRDESPATVDYVQDQHITTYSVQLETTKATNTRSARILQPMLQRARRTIESFEPAARYLREQLIPNIPIEDDQGTTRQLQQHLLQRQKMEAIGRLAGSIAQEYNNLLTIILTQTDLLLHSLPDDPAKQDLQVIVEACLKAAKLTEQLQAFSSQQFLPLQPLEINPMLRDLQPSLAKAAGDRELILDLQPQLPPLRADQTHLQDILTQLITNAREATTPGDTITLRTQLQPGPKPEVLLTIIDKGEGMPPDVRSRALDPFFTTKAGHQGLGLSNAYGTVQLFDGRLWIESRPDRGTRVELYLPCQTPSAPKHNAAEQPISPQASQEPPTILIVDHVPPRRKVAARILQHAGHLVHSASSTEQARDLLPTLDPIHMLIINPELPQAEQLQASIRHCPTLLLGTPAHPTLPCLPEPFSAKQLRDTVEQLL